MIFLLEPKMNHFNKKFLIRFLRSEQTGNKIKRLVYLFSLN